MKKCCEYSSSSLLFRTFISTSSVFYVIICYLCFESSFFHSLLNNIENNVIALRATTPIALLRIVLLVETVVAVVVVWFKFPCQRWCRYVGGHKVKHKPLVFIFVGLLTQYYSSIFNVCFFIFNFLLILSFSSFVGRQHKSFCEKKDR